MYSRKLAYESSDSGRVVTETVNSLRGTDTFLSTTTHSYLAGTHAVDFSTTVVSKLVSGQWNDADADAADTRTTYQYAWWDAAQQSSVTFDADTSLWGTTGSASPGSIAPIRKWARRSRC